MACSSESTDFKFTSGSPAEIEIVSGTVRDLRLDATGQLLFVYNEDDHTATDVRVQIRHGSDPIFEIDDDKRFISLLDIDLADGEVLVRRNGIFENGTGAGKLHFVAKRHVILECDRSGHGSSSAAIRFRSKSWDGTTEETFGELNTDGDVTFSGEEFRCTGLADISGGRLVTKVYTSGAPAGGDGRVGALALEFSGSNDRLWAKTGATTWQYVELTEVT